MQEKPTAGIVYLVPVPVAEGAAHTISPEVTEQTLHITHYFVENLRTARRFLKLLHPSINIDSLGFSEIDKHSGADIELFKKWLGEGHKIGIMSESGCPGVADPGSELVAVAHAMEASVVPLVGPSSILLALMASGFNGQSFCFRGYLPVKEPQRSKSLKDFEVVSIKEKQTQIFIETPYRNNLFLEDILKNCNNTTKVCIAQNITAPDAYIKTRTAANWKKDKPLLSKVPTVFLLLG